MVSVTAIIQARMGSTRSPSKSLRPIAGLPMLEHIIIRLKQVPEIDLILLAIPEKESEAPLIEFAHRLPIPVFQGSEEDVLDRFIKAGELAQGSIYREHVTTWFHDHASSFRIKRVNAPDYLKDRTFRLTVDTDQDFQLMEELFNNLPHSPDSPLNLKTAIDYLIAHPEIAALNIDIPQKNWREENY